MVAGQSWTSSSAGDLALRVTVSTTIVQQCGEHVADTSDLSFPDSSHVAGRGNVHLEVYPVAVVS